MNELDALRELLWMLVTSPNTGVLIGLLVVAAVMDWRTHRIPNWLTVGGMAYGLLVNATHSPSVGAGLLQSGSGLALGLALLLPFWLVRVLGAGDVKLMAAVGAFVGASAVFTATLWVFIAGGVLALWSATSRGKLRQLTANLRFIAFSLLTPAGAGGNITAASRAASVGKLPYGLAICAGSIAFLVARQIGKA